MAGQAPPYHPNCCPPDAPVLMPDGGQKPITEVKAGDWVAGRDGPTNVSRVFRRQTKEGLYHLSVAGRVLRLSGDHPVLTDHGWISARDLRNGMRVALLRSREGGLGGS